MSRGHIAALAAILFVLVGCAGPTSDEAAPAASSAAPLPDPKSALLASVSALDELNYEFRHGSSANGDVSGVVHGPSGTLELQHRVKKSETDIYDVRYRRIGDDEWILMDISRTADMPAGLPDSLSGKKWLPPGGISTNGFAGPLPFTKPGKGLTGVEGLVTGVVTATRKGTATFAGTLDLTGVEPGTLLLIPEEAHLAALGDRARALPFQATTDHKGRIRQFSFEVPGAGEFRPDQMTLSFEQYGTARPPSAPPAGEVGSAGDLKAAQDALRTIQQS
ncbi:hypothetical protein J2S43_003786 [Catenuloplanes nepalensis]|uniref:Lipoprotein n=1 Tax=Catenuloplanes nepalensis TaxID=587533 RepID=A0ABT9MV69_9ACTN|nr:hypothetical protein [Catenuloplanes nepalensis]MDP9795274.1 hypothetical protein [Catenuloplanes nepalensis]